MWALWPAVGPLPDAFASSAYQASLSTYNFTITVGSSDNRVLLVHVGIFLTGTVSSVSSDLSGSFTFVRSDTTGAYRSELWRLTAPATGTHTITVTLDASLTSIADAAAYYNADQVLPVEASNGATGTGDPATASVTTLTEFATVYGGLATAAASGVTSSAGQDSRTINSGALGTSATDDVRQVNPTGSQALTWTGLGVTDVWAITLASIRIPQPVVFDPATIAGFLFSFADRLERTEVVSYGS